ncbi:Cof-type HAD-IIB family hydrolase [Aneurinibacillus terranovensis]|uniref:Cof-type HAD-IIB family hydrolase n=1 Tax=Aneurinibacillus terranovensis TaxID=278991 RepID=UPI00040E8624|nr:Cof-type HAD-IIB family hydrolase [Aneurinibacillus terranovensis]
MELIALDMDGTLLTSRGEISKENAHAIKEVQQKGIKVVIATGRSLDSAKIRLEQAELICPIISVNGAAIFLEDGTKVDSTPLSLNTVHEILTILHEKYIYCEIYTNYGTYTTDDVKQKLMVEVDYVKSINSEQNANQLLNAVEKQNQQALLHFVKSFDEVLSREDLEIYKILTFSLDEKKLTEIRSKLTGMSDLFISSSAYHNIEITNTEAHKGNALRKIADYYHIPLKKTMAIGDNMNDLTMLQTAGIGVAMGNAVDEIKNICRFTTKINDEHGVQYAIEHFTGR